jgi:hypothetical protein
VTEGACLRHEMPGGETPAGNGTGTIAGALSTEDTLDLDEKAGAPADKKAPAVRNENMPASESQPAIYRNPSKPENQLMRVRRR